MSMVVTRVLVFAAVAGAFNHAASRSAPRRCGELRASADDGAPMSWASSMSTAPVLDDAVAEAAAGVRAQLGASRGADLAIVHASAAFGPQSAAQPTVRIRVVCMSTWCG